MTRTNSENSNSNFVPIDNKTFYWLSEQVSHHPPISALFGETADKSIVAEGWYFPKSKFLGNSAASHIEGQLKIKFNNIGQEYTINWPTVYARGLFIGKLAMEISGDCTIECNQTRIKAEIKFHSKPFFRGDYNVVSGKITRDKETLATFKGKWDETVEVNFEKKYKKEFIRENEKSKERISQKVRNISSQTQSNLDISQDNYESFFQFPPRGKKIQIFDCSKVVPLKKRIPIKQHIQWNESIEVWKDLTVAVNNKDMKSAQDAKFAVEEAQRDRIKERTENGEIWKPKFFEMEDNGFWKFIGQESPEYKLLFQNQMLDTQLS